MKNQSKKLLALGLSLTMMLGTCIPAAMAEGETSGSTTGAGTNEGHVEKSKLSVTLPTATASTFGFIADPEGLIKETSGAAHTGATFAGDAKGVYFQSSTNNYTAESEKLKVTNKGSEDATVTLTAEVTTNDDSVTIASTEGAATGAAATGAALYLGLKTPTATEGGTEVKPVGEQQASQDPTCTVKLTVKGRPQNFEVQYNTNYEYAVKEGVADTAWNSFEFSMVGAAGGVWHQDATDKDLAAPTVTVTWAYAKQADSDGGIAVPENAVTRTPAGPSGPTETLTFAASATSLDIDCDLGFGEPAATAISSVVLSNNNFTLCPSVEYGNQYATVTNGKVTLTSDTLTFVKNRFSGQATIDITFNDSETTVIHVAIAVEE